MRRKRTDGMANCTVCVTEEEHKIIKDLSFYTKIPIRDIFRDYINDVLKHRLITYKERMLNEYRFEKMEAELNYLKELQIKPSSNEKNNFKQRDFFNLDIIGSSKEVIGSTHSIL